MAARKRMVKNMMIAKLTATFFGILILSGCVTQAKVDYSEFRASRPASILVLPPVNSSPDVAATYSLLSQATFPLAESGYYVMPVTLVDEAFRIRRQTFIKFPCRSCAKFLVLTRPCILT
jgi:hypothetical protein